MSKGKTLIIVESPAKIKTLKKFVGSQYEFESSVGHIRDLPSKEFGIDVEGDFEPTYVTMPDKKEVIQKLQRAAKQADMVYLSPDPDREGEAIAWHISQILPPSTVIKRVSFNSITKDAVLRELQNPTTINISLVNAQQARRLLDRIVGYKISPILNRKMQRGKNQAVSAGRVQSVALKLVVDREKEIQAFKPVEYWNLGCIFVTEEEPEKSFKAYLYSIDGKRVEKEPVEGKEVALIGSKEVAERIAKEIAQATFKVLTVEKKEKRRNPVPPFITSTLQQEASRHHGFSSSKTMQVAQSLYEGVDLGSEGAEGLITYMRTDSVRIAPEALDEARDYILKTYGQDFLPPQAKVYSTNKTAQDAHEAIRPTNLKNHPEKIQKYLSREQFLLYQLIWRRFIASQMMPAVYDTVVADISAGSRLVLRATGSMIKFQGFLAVYEEKFDDLSDDKDDSSKMLPPLKENQLLKLLELLKEQAFTRPPPRFSEASLVKELEKSGIGRPSTYAAIMSKIQSREYTIKEQGRLKPTELGQVIAQMLESNFQQIMNIGFTAAMEDDLELVAANKKNWKDLLRDFWTNFIPTVDAATKDMFVPKVQTDLICPQCGSHLQKVWFKDKYFYGCSSYPTCTYTAPIEELSFNKEDYAEDFDWDQLCPKCQSPMKLRHGKFGSFLGCTTYPKCKGIVNIPKRGEAVISQENLPHCPAKECPGTLVARKSRFGKVFYSCSTYPECDVIGNTVEQVLEKYADHPRTPYVKKQRWAKKEATSSKGKEKSKETNVESKKFSKSSSGIKKTASTKTKTTSAKKASPRNFPTQKLSSDLAAIVGANEMARTEVLKKVWEYIKSHGLQDKKNKRLINPDPLLSKVFGSNEPIDMFKMTALLNKHIE